MDTGLSNAMAVEFARLRTYQQYPLEERGSGATGGTASLLSYNSPVKLAKAGFCYYPEARNGQFRCFKCKVSYSGLNGESPMAVHRILNRKCPHVKFLTPASLTAPAARALAKNVCRRLDLGPSGEENVENNAVNPEENNINGVLDVYDRLRAPATPEGSDTEEEDGMDNDMDLMFESHRLLTFPSPTHPRAEEWASAGFTHLDGGVVRCVFCQLEMPYDTEYPTKMHQQRSQKCPLVEMMDVGNVTRELENKVRSSNENSDSDRDTSGNHGNPLFKHPQYEDLRTRMETYIHWPRRMLPIDDVLSQAGFYYTGYTDKVQCFACGTSLRNWDPESDPWVEHAHFAAHCVYVRQKKGDSFITDAQQAEVMTECDSLHDCDSSQDVSPLRPSLDVAAIQAALACQYDVMQIRHAILKFFLASRGYYPNKALLLGTLQASDATFSQLQRARETIHNNHISISRHVEQLHERDQELDRRDEVIDEHLTVLQREQAERQRLEREQQTRLIHESMLQGRLQGQSQVIRSHVQVIQNRDQVIQSNQQRLNQLESKEEEFQRKEREMERQSAELRRQTEELRRLRQLLQANNIVDNVADDNNIVNNVADDNIIVGDNNANQQPAQEEPAIFEPSLGYTVCNMCGNEDARCVLRPCRHVCCGTNCAPRFVGGPCPICRQNVNDWEIIFVS